MNGLIIQWGYATSSNELGNIDFPIDFTTTNYAAFLTYDSGTEPKNYDYAPRVYSKTLNGFKAYLMRNPPKTYWFAIGY